MARVISSSGTFESSEPSDSDVRKKDEKNVAGDMPSEARSVSSSSSSSFAPSEAPASESQLLSSNSAHDSAAGSVNIPIRPKIIDFSARRKEKTVFRRYILMKRCIAFFGGVFAIFMLVWTVLFSPIFRVNENTSQIEGANEWVTESQILKIVAEKTNRVYFAVNEKDISSAIMQLPGVCEADVSRKFPHSLHIKINASGPIAILHTAAGRYISVDGQGRAFASESDKTSVPIIDVNDADSALSNKAVHEALAVLSKLDESQRSAVTQTTAITQDSVTTAFESGYSVIWGNSENMDLKNEIVKRAEQQITSDGKPGFSQIDVSSPSNPVIKQ